MKDLRPLNRIPIFFDPIEQQHKEGIATLVKLIAEMDSDGCELWQVKFTNRIENRRIFVEEE